MNPPSQESPADAFTLELLRAGLMLSALACDVAETLAPDAYPGEDPHNVVVDMISGTIRTFLNEQDEAEVLSATDLISGALGRVLEHLQLALALRKRMDGKGDSGRLYEEPVPAEDTDDVNESEAPAPPSAQPSHPRVLPGATERQDPLGQLATELLECGAVLSQVITHMFRFERSGRSAPDAAPIPEVAHRLVRDVIAGMRKHHSKRDIVVASRIVREATDAITNDTYLVSPRSLAAEWN